MSHELRQFHSQRPQCFSPETDVWIADEPDHMIHFNGNRFPGPYSDAMPPKP